VLREILQNLDSKHPKALRDGILMDLDLSDAAYDALAEKLGKMTDGPP
jgi:hypothetical protein